MRAWPTLHKDVALARDLGVDTPQLIPVAEATIAELVRRRAGWVAAREARGSGG